MTHSFTILALLLLGIAPLGADPKKVVAISPSAYCANRGAIGQFVATVTGGSNAAVDWYVNGVLGGNATVGTISTAGLYTAPNVIDQNTSVTVKAQIKGASPATVTIYLQAIAISISPALASVGPNQAVTLTATVNGACP